jgi:uncharacterized protein YrzB (UPF0473 family)
MKAGGARNMAKIEKCEECGYDIDKCVCDEEADFLTLEFDDGAEVECEIMGVFDCDGKEYIALLPEDGTDDVYIYGYVEVGEDEFDLVDIDDDAEFERVVAEFDKVVADME